MMEGNWVDSNNSFSRPFQRQGQQGGGAWHLAMSAEKWALILSILMYTDIIWQISAGTRGPRCSFWHIKLEINTCGYMWPNVSSITLLIRSKCQKKLKCSQDQEYLGNTVGVNSIPVYHFTLNTVKLMQIHVKVKQHVIKNRCCVTEPD